MDMFLWRLISPHRRKEYWDVLVIRFLFVFLFCANVTCGETENLQYFIKENEEIGTVIATLSETNSSPTFIYSSGVKY